MEPTLEAIYAKCEIVGGHAVWRGSCTGDGRPIWRCGGRERPVRQLVYELRTGEPVPQGKMACWTCDVERCVSHVKAMTKQERGALSASRGKFRTPERIAAVMRGQRKRVGKMTMERAEQLRERRRQGATYHQLAAEFGIHCSLAHRIVKGDRWAPEPTKVTVIPRKPGKYEVVGPFERAITRDWLDSRLQQVSRASASGQSSVSSSLSTSLMPA